MSKEILHLCSPRKLKPEHEETEPDSGPDPGSTDYWEEIHKAQQAKRAQNRKSPPELLTEAGIEFQSRNEGAHFILPFKDSYVDFWPGTGLWIPRGTKRKSRGVKKLIAYIKGAKK